MHLRPLVGGLVLSASLPMMGIATSPPAPSHADVSIVVSAAESCVWYMENLPAVINMQSATKYKGEPISVSATISPAIGFSGNPEVPGYSTACSFFNSSFTTKKLQVAIDGNEFVARHGGTRDNSLSFGLDQRPLLVEISNVDESCRNVTGMPLTVASNFGWGINKSDVSAAIDIVAYSDVPDYGVKNFFSSGNSANCAPELEFGVEISSEQSGPPAGAGLTYVFTGPSITFTLEAVANSFDSIAMQSQSAFSDSGTSPTATLTSRTIESSTETFAFSVDSSEIIYAGSLYGTAAEFRFVPTSATWSFSRPEWTNIRTNPGFDIERSFNRDGKKFNTWVTLGYRIDYRYPGTDWIIAAASEIRVSERVELWVPKP